MTESNQPHYIVYDTFTGNIKGMTLDRDIAETWGHTDEDYYGDQYIIHVVSDLNLQPKRK